MNRAALSELEKSIISLKKEPSNNYEALDKVVKNYCTLFGFTENNLGIFSIVTNPIEKKFLLALIIRVIDANQTLIWNYTDFRIKALSYVRKNHHDFLSNLKLGNTDITQNHLLVENITAYYLTFLKKCEEVKNSIVNKEVIQKIPQKILAISRASQYSTLIESFIDSSLLQPEKLNSIFEYSRLLTSDVFSNQKNQSELVFSLKRYLQDSKINETAPTKALIIEPIQKVINLLEASLSEEFKIRSAEIDIETIERKYPLNSIREEFDILLRLTNNGRGDAQNVIVNILSHTSGFIFANDEVFVGELNQGNIEVTFYCSLSKPIKANNSIIKVRVSWIDFDGTKKELIKILTIKKQEVSIDWNCKNPYSLEAVKDVKYLVGRKELIDELLSNFTGSLIESSIITGQKRVGKSSIGKSLQSVLNEKPDFIAIFIEIGGLDKLTPERFVSDLGNTIIEEIVDKLPSDLLKQIKLPEFDGSLSLLIKFLKRLNKILSSKKYVIIIDEFDEIPNELIFPNPVGDTFFHNIRSLVQEDNIALVLIGGENMQFIQQTTDRLNKFNISAVDYFDREKYLNDFNDLITSPIKNGIEYGKDALSLIYEYTEGNPFYTKMLCKDLFNYSINNKIAYITSKHVEKIVTFLIEKMEIIHINHFWKDNIVADDPIKKDNIETQRRKFLMGFAQLKRENKNVNEKNLSELSILREGVSIGKVFESYKNRKILISKGEIVRLKPKLIEKWLIETGWQEISTSFLNEDAMKIYQIKDANAYISDKEILELSEKWELYKGKQMTPSIIREWLNQFDDNIERRYIYNLLRNLKFYNEIEVRSKLKTIHRSIIEELPVATLTEKDKSRNDLVITSLDKLGKSSSHYVRLYRSVNDIRPRNIIELNTINKAIDNNHQLKAIVLINDIIGSGNSFIKDLSFINEKFGKRLKERNITIYLSSICGYSEGIDKINEFVAQLEFKIRILTIDIVTDKQTCKAVDSEFYETEMDGERTINIIRKYTGFMRPDNDEFTYFGYKDTGLLVVFYEACPNNTIPLIWHEEFGKWKPLFKR